jgi:hypothetical protein
MKLSKHDMNDLTSKNMAYLRFMNKLIKAGHTLPAMIMMKYKQQEPGLSHSLRDYLNEFVEQGHRMYPNLDKHTQEFTQRVLQKEVPAHLGKVATAAYAGLMTVKKAMDFLLPESPPPPLVEGVEEPRQKVVDTYYQILQEKQKGQVTTKLDPNWIGYYEIAKRSRLPISYLQHWFQSNDRREPRELMNTMVHMDKENIPEQELHAGNAQTFQDIRDTFPPFTFVDETQDRPQPGIYETEEARNTKAIEAYGKLIQPDTMFVAYATPQEEEMTRRWVQEGDYERVEAFLQDWTQRDHQTKRIVTQAAGPDPDAKPEEEKPEEPKEEAPQKETGGHEQPVNQGPFGLVPVPLPKIEKKVSSHRPMHRKQRVLEHNVDLLKFLKQDKYRSTRDILRTKKEQHKRKNEKKKKKSKILR